ncbi:MAG: ABC transporter permease [Candidatus Brocadiia bacterium]
MLFWTIVKVSLRSLRANKLRTFLAMLGIIIGVAAVISMLAIGAGAQKSILSRLSSLGTNLLIVRPGSSGSHGVSSGTQQTLKLSDAEALLNQVSGINMLSPVVGGSAQAKYLNKNNRVSVNGVDVTWMSVRDFSIDVGRCFSSAEVESMGRVAVIGPVTAQTLFEGEDPREQTIKLNGINFRVVGVLKSKGDQGWFNPDDQVLVPYTTAMSILFGVDYLREIDIEANDGVDLTAVQTSVSEILRKRHRIADDADNDFEVMNQAEMISTVTSVSDIFSLLLGGIAGISLLVGGIGIMNIMLVTVTERTREIGIRKAIGAKRGSVMMQFLIESVVLSGLGGFFGVALGAGLSLLVSKFTQFPSVITMNSVILALSFSFAVGVFFGWYPARRAAGLDPIEALRYE